VKNGDTAKPKPGGAKDRRLFVALVRAHRSDVATVSVIPSRLNRPGSPVWNAHENLVPILALLLSSLVLMIAVNLIVGLGATVLSVVIYLVAVRPWILLRVSRRATDAALANLHNWQVLWKRGGLKIVHKTKLNQCDSPGGDWRAFVTANLPIVDPEETGRRLMTLDPGEAAPAERVASGTEAGQH